MHRGENSLLQTLTIFLAFVALTIALLGGLAFAQLGGQVTPEGSTTQQGAGLRISPLRQEITGKPGEVKKVSVSVQNLNPAPITLKPISNDFIAGNKEDGTPSIILDEKEFAPTQSLKRFMQPMGNITLAASERRTIDVQLAIPDNAMPGSYYGAIRFAPANEDGTEALNVSGSVASLILLSIPGNVIENLRMKSFDIVQGDSATTRFNSSNDLSAVIRLENKGNIHVSPFGDVFVLKGKDIIYSSKINDIKPAGLVLPNSVRRFEVPLKNLGNFGKYTVTATIGYGGNGETMEVSKQIWIVPTSYMLIGAGVIIGLIAIVSLVVVALRSYKKKILRSARRR